MKINTLMTLSQFVDEISNGELSTIETKADNISQLKLYLIYKYNLFLKQPLKKEMFVNEIVKPNDKFNLLDDIEAFKKAEKKVIFANVGIDDNIIFLDEDIQIHFALLSTFDLSTLARLGDGELKLKNIEI